MPDNVAIHKIRDLGMVHIKYVWFNCYFSNVLLRKVRSIDP